MPDSAIWQTVETMNRLWTEGDGTGLERYFHPEMLAIAAAFPGRTEGGAACVAAWQEFARSAKVHYYRTSEHWIRQFGPTAVVAYRYEMEWIINGAVVQQTGRDLFTLIEGLEGRQVVADHFSPEPAPPENV